MRQRGPNEPLIKHTEVDLGDGSVISSANRGEVSDHHPHLDITALFEQK